VKGNCKTVSAQERFLCEDHFVFFRGPRPFEEGTAFFPGGKLMLSLTEAKATFLNYFCNVKLG